MKDIMYDYFEIFENCFLGIRECNFPITFVIPAPDIGRSRTVYGKMARVFASHKKWNKKPPKAMSMMVYGRSKSSFLFMYPFKQNSSTPKYTKVWKTLQKKRNSLPPFLP